MEFLIEEFLPLGLIMKGNGRGRRTGLAFPGGRNPRSDPKLGTCPERGLGASAKRGRGTHQPPGQPGGIGAGRHRRPAPPVRAGSSPTSEPPARDARASCSASQRPPAGPGGAGPPPTLRPQRLPAAPQCRESGAGSARAAASAPRPAPRHPHPPRAGPDAPRLWPRPPAYLARARGRAGAPPPPPRRRPLVPRGQALGRRRSSL